MPISPLSYAWRGMPSVAVAKMASVASGVAGCFPGRPRDLNGSWWKVGGRWLECQKKKRLDVLGLKYNREANPSLFNVLRARTPRCHSTYFFGLNEAEVIDTILIHKPSLACALGHV